MIEIINSEKALYDHIDQLRAKYKEHKFLRVDVKTGKQRSNLQNASLHLYCNQIAEQLNDAGISFNEFFKEGVEVPWTMEIVKDNIWRPIQVVMVGEESTTKPLTDEYPKIYEVINRKLSELLINVPWPCKESHNA